MGTKDVKLSEALFSGTQRRVLALLFGDPDRSFYANEIVRAARAGVGSVQRELESLARAGLVTVTRLGNQKHYRANRDSPIFGELRSIIAKVLGDARPAAAVLQQPQAQYPVGARPAKLHIPRKRIAALCRKYGVKKLSLFGSAARGELAPESDVDLMVEFKPGSRVSLWDIPEMQDEFSALFDKRKVDIASPEILENPYRRKTIEPDLKVLYEARRS
jgi:predicted nucleotidyltransferase/DNA-binding transcriptional ArsR family regulator